MDAKITYRKTRQGEWVTLGPAELIRQAVHDRAPVTVTKRDGSTSQVVLRTDGSGKPFKADGQMMAYGYIDRDATAALAPRDSYRAVNRLYGQDMHEYASGSDLDRM